jgi:hypothetical protein
MENNSNNNSNNSISDYNCIDLELLLTLCDYVKSDRLASLYAIRHSDTRDRDELSMLGIPAIHIDEFISMSSEDIDAHIYYEIMCIS